MKPTLHYLTSALTLAFVLSPLFAQPTEPVVAALTVNGRVLEMDEPALVQDDFLLIASSVLNSEFGLNVEAAENGMWRLRVFEQQFLFRADSRTYRYLEQERQLGVAPLLRGAELFIPVQALVGPLGLRVDHDGGWKITSPAAAVQNLRQGTHKDRVRFVVDLSAPALFRWYEEPGRLVLEFPATPDEQGRRNLLRQHEFEDGLAAQVNESQADGFVRLAITHTSGQPPVLFTLKEPARIVVDLLRGPASCPAPVQQQEAPRPHPGDIWDTHVFAGSKGPVRGFVIRFNPTKTGWRLKPSLAGNTIMQRSAVSRIASRTGAYGAINGGYFSLLGPPLGMLVIDGEWVKSPLYNRAVLGISKNGEYAIARTDFNARVEFDGLGFLPLESVNEGHRGGDSVVLYNRRWGPVVTGSLYRTRLVVGAEGTVVAILAGGQDAPLPSGGFVLSGSGQRAETLKKVPIGTAVKLDLQTNPRWPDLQHAIGGGPILVTDGKVTVNGAAERFRNDITIGCRPRSAVGLAGNGDVILLAVQEPGMTLRELAGVLVKLGAQSAMNLDGGGSTTIVVGGKLLNVPGDGCERAVSNALLVVKS